MIAVPAIELSQIIEKLRVSERDSNLCIAQKYNDYQFGGAL